jgi:hypothetical protein
MAAIGAASLDLSQSALALARVGWTLMFGVVACAAVVFAQRARYAGVGLLALGQRAIVLAVVALALLVGARMAASRRPPHVARPPAAVSVSAIAERPSAVETAPPVAAQPSPSAAPAPPEASASAAPSTAPSGAAPPAPGHPGELQIDAVATRGMLEADARGGVQRRIERLQACLADPKNQQSGALSLKIGIDPAGSVAYSRATGGDLLGTPLAACLLAVFYKMGFAAPASSSASFEIVLRVPAP